MFEDAGLVGEVLAGDEDLPALGELDLAGVGGRGLGKAGEVEGDVAGTEEVEGVGDLLLGGFSEAGEFVVGEHVGQLGRVGGVVLEADGDGRPRAGGRGEDGTVAFDDVPATLGDDDGAPPAVPLDDAEVKGELRVGVAVGIPRIRLQIARRDHLVVEAVNDRHL